MLQKTVQQATKPNFKVSSDIAKKCDVNRKLLYYLVVKRSIILFCSSICFLAFLNAIEFIRNKS